MGDRGNIFFVDVRQGETFAGIYMYTHWSGSSLPGLVREALKRGRGRWGDAPYLARVVFCELVKDSILEEVGFGLSTKIGDNEHTIVRIDDLAGRVSFHAPGREWRASDPGLASWSYEDYLAAPAIELERVFFAQLEESLPGAAPKPPRAPRAQTTKPTSAPAKQAAKKTAKQAAKQPAKKAAKQPPKQPATQAAKSPTKAKAAPAGAKAAPAGAKAAPTRAKIAPSRAKTSPPRRRAAA